MLKKCSQCKKEKSIDSFHRNINRSDGRSYICKECYRKNYKKSYNRKRIEIRHADSSERKELKEMMKDKTMTEMVKNLYMSGKNTLLISKELSLDLRLVNMVAVNFIRK